MTSSEDILYGVRISKPDGDEEYRWAMTRPDPPYRPRPIRPAIEQKKPEPEQKLVIHEVKEAPDTEPAPPEEDIDQMLAIAVGPTKVACVYIWLQDGEAKCLPVTFAEAEAILELGVHYETQRYDTDAQVDEFVRLAFLESGIEPDRKPEEEA